MPEFYVYGGHDAWAVYRTKVTADTPDEARRKVQMSDEVAWEDIDETIQFDAFEIFTENGSVVPVEAVDDEAVEIQVFKMKHHPDGDSPIQEGEELDYIDVWVRKVEPDASGEIQVLEEFEEIPDGPLAEQIVQLLLLKYPEAGVEHVS